MNQKKVYCLQYHVFNVILAYIYIVFMQYYDCFCVLRINKCEKIGFMPVSTWNFKIAVLSL